jgi:hypothetical protein
MRHLLLAAPLLALATACSEPCTAPALTVSWAFTRADGASGLGCADAGVESVDLWIDGVQVGSRIACAQGSATFTGLAAGDHVYTARGNRADGTARYQTWGGVALAACGETRALVQPGAGTLRVDYATSTDLCYALDDASQTTGYVWFQLLDRSTGAVAWSVNGAQTPTALPCRTGADGWFDLEVPWGLYRLRWIQVVINPASSVPTPIYQYCPALAPPPVPTIDVDVVQAGRTTLAAPMTPPSAACIP